MPAHDDAIDGSPTVERGMAGQGRVPDTDAVFRKERGR
jgi:hypothetical protein